MISENSIIRGPRRVHVRGKSHWRAIEGEQAPPWIRPKALAMALLELAEARNDLRHPARARVLQRTPSKRGKPGCEDRTGIEQIGILHHALAQHRDRLVQHGQ